MCGSVALVAPGLCLGEFSVTSATTHSQRLIASIDTLLTSCGVPIDALDAIAISLGPGSFTGVRIGLTTAKGLAFATGKKLIGVHTLDALAIQAANPQGLVCAMLDARKSEVFAALYKNGTPLQTIEGSTASVVASIASICATISEPTTFIGDGALLYKEQIKSQLGALASFLSHEIYFPRAASVGRCAIDQWRTNSFIDPATTCPIYVRASDAEINFPPKSSQGSI